ncbi:MAG TPA: SDR family NAD(P)-dependent oxidoreductase [Aeromicrobium sp.]|nr:SDR family NAD(P)-dependent oxidoreductase [Aeromicrobium sp.]
MPLNLAGARVLITGATGGIGHAIVRAFHARGAELLLTGRRTEVLDDLIAEVGGKAIEADLADAESVSELMEQAGGIDVLVANAALPGDGALGTFTETQIDRALDVNLRAPIVLSRWAAEQMVPRGRGHIILIGSLAGRAASPRMSMYNASKFGLRGFALAYREELRGTGVGVSLIAPGFVSEAGMFADSGNELPPGMRAVSPDDVANAVLRSIDKDLGEVSVAPPELKAMSMLAVAAPRVSAAMQRKLGLYDAFDDVGGGEKR